jgi:hypothetical protein
MSAVPLILEGEPGPKTGTIRLVSGVVHEVPIGWVHLPPGDAALTRRVKAAGKYWLLSEKRGRKTFSRGMFAPLETIDSIRQDLEIERSSPAFARKMEADKKRREQTQVAYQGEFEGAVLAFLRFHAIFQELAERLARLVTIHATPVGSGTVARTKRIPLERRAEAAVIAWMRHQTTAYDQMSIPKVKGMRREVRRMLAARSRELLADYRSGRPIPGACPLKKALEKSGS